MSVKTVKQNICFPNPSSQMHYFTDKAINIMLLGVRNWRDVPWKAAVDKFLARKWRRTFVHSRVEPGGGNPHCHVVQRRGPPFRSVQVWMLYDLSNSSFRLILFRDSNDCFTLRVLLHYLQRFFVLWLRISLIKGFMALIMRKLSKFRIKKNNYVKCWFWWGFFCVHFNVHI